MQFDTSKYLRCLKTKNLGKNIIYLNQTSSTNDEVWNHLKNNNHIVVVTENQKREEGEEILIGLA